MSKVRLFLALAFLSVALLLIAFFATNLLTFPISFLYRGVANLATARTVAQFAALTAALGLFIGASIIAIPVALAPGKFGVKLLHAVPLFTLVFTLAVVVMNALGIGMDANLFMPGFSVTTALVTIGAISSTIAVTLAAGRKSPERPRQPEPPSQPSASRPFPRLLPLPQWSQSVAIVSTSQPSARFPGGPGGEGQPQPAEAVQRAPGTGIIQQGQPGQPTTGGQSTQPGTGTRPAPGNQPQRQGDGNGPGAGPGGFSPASFVSRFQTGGALSAVFLILGLVTTTAGWRAMGGAAAGAAEIGKPTNFKTNAAGSGAAFAGIAAIVFIAMQFVQLPHTNPPVTTTVSWDSAQTQALAERACMDCHSNTTKWPWYSYIAPGSWINVLDVKAAREQVNLSDLGSIQAFRRAQLARDMAENIQNGSMPPKDYILLHPEAQLSTSEKQQLIQGLQISFK